MPPPISLSEIADSTSREFPMGFAEFVTLMASLMALNALAIDAMLPAFPAIGEALGVTDANDRQLVIGYYLLGSGIGALFYGPLADRYGRRPVLFGALAGYALFALGGALVQTFDLLLTLRFAQGLAAAALGVCALAVIRDRFEGDAMARLVSLVFIVFMAVPIIAPTIGQLILYVAHWRAIFALFVLLSAGVAIWTWIRLPETLKPEYVIPIRPRNIVATWRAVVFHRGALGYVLGSGIMMSALFGFLNSSQQIFADVFGEPDLFPYAFGAVASAIAVSNWFNSRIVEKFGARRVSHTALFAFIALSVLQLVLALTMPQSMALFIAMMAINMSMVGFTGSNFGAIAMQPFGAMAGAASSFQQAARMVIAALGGGFIGQQFDGSTVPIAIGFIVCGIGALLCVTWSENGTLFRRREAAVRS